ncbi:MAG: hypothetical protein SF053_04365 [Bacteroidia bacterium]|nr:hypothetical protein [Bacteroidia bacterium]
MKPVLIGLIGSLLALSACKLPDPRDLVLELEIRDVAGVPVEDALVSVYPSGPLYEADKASSGFVTTSARNGTAYIYLSFDLPDLAKKDTVFFNVRSYWHLDPLTGKFDTLTNHAGVYYYVMPHLRAKTHRVRVVLQ